MNRIFQCFAAVLFTLAPLFAQAQDAGVDGHGFQMVAQDGDPRDLLGVQRPGIFHAGDFYTSALMEFAGESVTQVLVSPGGGDSTYSSRLSNLFGVNVGGGVAVHDRVRLDLAMPLFFVSNGRNGQQQGGGLGDMRFAVSTAILRAPTGGGFGLSVVPFVDLPTGTARKFMGQGGVGGGLKVALGYELSKLTLSADLGVDLNDSQQVANLSNPHQFQAGLGVGFLVTDDIGLNAEFLMSQQLSSASDAFSPNGAESPMQAALSVRGKTKPGAHWLVGGSAGLSRGIGAAQFRIFAGGGFGKIKESVAAPSNDPDGDGILGEADKCPKEAETYNDFKDDDGCPDSMASLSLIAAHYDNPVEDLDIAITGGGGTQMTKTRLDPVVVSDLRPGVYDIRAMSPSFEGNLQTRLRGGENEVVLEVFPTEPGTLNIVAVDSNNAPVLGATVTIAAPGGGDGIQLDLDDQGAGTAELAPGGYTVYIQADGFGIFRRDVSISSRENKEFRAILGEARASVSEKTIEINEKVFFALDSTVIEKRSHALLDEIAALLQRDASILLVEISGHTSSDGTTEHNKQLSIERAQAVVQFLTSRGVADFRLKFVGYGEEQPLNTEDPESSENRRVEFNILKRK